MFVLSKFSQLLAKFCLFHPAWFEGFFWVLASGFLSFVCLIVLKQAASPPDLVTLPKLLISLKGEDRGSSHLFPARLREERERVIARVSSPAGLQGLPFAYCGI